MSKIKVAMCDDMSELCLYYNQIINAEADMECVGTAGNYQECISLVSEKKPDILLLDIQIDTTRTGIELIPKIKKLCPLTKIIMLTVHEQDDMIFEAITEGANDYLLKTYSDEFVIETIRSVYNNDSHAINEYITQNFVRHSALIKNKQKSLLYILNNFISLSSTEIEIIKDIYYGNSYKDIAKKRFVEEITIRTHVSRILKKMGFHSMKELIKTLQELKIFDLLDR